MRTRLYTQRAIISICPAKEKKISRSELLRRSFKQYIASEKRWQMIRAWGAESARKMNLKDERDLERIIHEYRAE
jgi:hypothetical protein